MRRLVPTPDHNFILPEKAMTSDSVPPESFDDLAQVAAARRTELAKTYLSASQAQSLLGIDSATLTDWRKGKRLLGVWHEPAKAWLYPDFQFDHQGLHVQMPQLLAVFDRHYSHVWSNTWTIVEWFLSPHALLDGARPMDILACELERVLEIAKSEFLQDPSTQW
jgi:hypothetical protein